MLVCNSIPLVSEDNFGIWKRIRLIDFKVLFCDNPDKKNPYQKLLNKKLSKQIIYWAPYMAGFLVHWLQILESEGLNEPIEVMKSTEEYKDDNDEWKDFRDKHLINNQDQYIQWKDLQKFFDKWLKMKGKSSLDNKQNKELKKYLERHLGKIVNTTRDGKNLYGFLNWELNEVFFD